MLKSVKDYHPTQEESKKRATVLYLSMFYCVKDLDRNSHLVVLKTLVQIGAKIDTKSVGANQILEATTASTLSRSAALLGEHVGRSRRVRQKRIHPTSTGGEDHENLAKAERIARVHAQNIERRLKGG